MKKLLVERIAIVVILIVITILSCNRKNVANESKGNDTNRSESGNVDYLNFVSGSYLANEKIFESDKKVEHSQSEIVNDKIVKVIQFETLPDNEMKSKMTKDGIELLDYIPIRAFIAFMPKGLSYSDLNKINVIAISDYKPEMKMDRYLSKNEFPDYVLDEGRLRINVHPFRIIELDSLEKELLKKNNIEVLNIKTEHHYIEVLTEKSKLDSIASISIVKFIETGYSDPVPDNSKTKGDHDSDTNNSSSPREDK